MTIEGFTAGDLTASALLGITILLILFGRLKPKSDVDRADKNAENWRLVAEAERAARVAADAQTAELLELAKLTYSVMCAVFEVQTKAHRSGGADVVSTRES
jgi:hypothetical protein